MKEFELRYKIYKANNSKEILLFCGGDGDFWEDFDQLATVIKDNFNINICAFSYREVDGEVVLENTVQDLREILGVLKDNFDYEVFNLFATSMGAYCASIVSSQSSFEINNTLLFDPADYYIDEEVRKSEKSLHNPNLEYLPISETVSSELKMMKSKTKIHVINFLLRNCKNDNYIEKDYSNRGIDYEDGITRISNNMVESFYRNTPQRNRGLYIEEYSLPHSFLRDGDIKENGLRIAKTISYLLST